MPMRETRAPGEHWLWHGHLAGSSGMARVGRQLLGALWRRGTSIAVAEASARPVAAEIQSLTDWSPEARERRAVLSHVAATGRGQVVHHPLTGLPLAEAGSNAILYTVFETDGVPVRSLPAVCSYRQVWVPSVFCADVLLREGLAKERVRVVPHGAAPAWAEVAARRAQRCRTETFRFLSVFQWEYRKAPDLLVRAFRAAFPTRTDVRLTLVTAPRAGDPLTGAWPGLRRALDDALGRARDPRVELIESTLSDAALHDVYVQSDAFVLASRGEGFCLPALDALAGGLPCIVPAHGALAELVRGTGARTVPVAGHRCPPDGVVAPYAESMRRAPLVEPDFDALVALLRDAVTDSDAAASALADAAGLRDRYSWDRAAQAADEALADMDALVPHVGRERATPRTARTQSSPATVRLEGPFVGDHSLARVNRGLAGALAPASAGRLELRQSEAAPHAGLPWLEELLRARPTASASSFTVRHAYPPLLGPTPRAERSALYVPWEYGHFPSAWVADIDRHALRELWVPSSAVREMAVRSGVSEERIHVIPNGVDVGLFTPHGPLATALPSTAGCRFLFVGNGMPRKGLDVALTAFSAAFHTRDDVALLVKLSAAGGRYDLREAHARIDAVRAAPGAPKIYVTDRHLDDAELASLYRSVTCVLAPYRGEGFCLPVLEAQACGCPAIVTAGGATDDFVDDGVGLRVESRESALPHGTADGLALAGPGYWREPHLDHLVAVLRRVYDGGLSDPGLRAGCATRAARFGWAHAARAVLARVDAT